MTSCCGEATSSGSIPCSQGNKNNEQVVQKLWRNKDWLIFQSFGSGVKLDILDPFGMLVMCWRRQLHTSASLLLHFIIRKCREEYTGYHFIQSSLILFLICYGDFFKGCHPEFFSPLRQEGGKGGQTALSQSSLGNLSQGLISCRRHMVLVAMLIGKKFHPPSKLHPPPPPTAVLYTLVLNISSSFSKELGKRD